MDKLECLNTLPFMPCRDPDGRIGHGHHGFCPQSVLPVAKEATRLAWQAGAIAQRNAIVKALEGGMCLTDFPVPLAENPVVKVMEVPLVEPLTEPPDAT